MIKSILLFLFASFISLSLVKSQSIGQKLFETKDYKILFPNQFTKSIQPVLTSLGKLEMTIISYEPNSDLNDSNYVYMLMESDYPDSTIHSDKTELLDDFFQASINGAVKNVNGKLLKETKILTGGFPGRLIEIDYQNGLAVINMKMILIRNKMVMVQTITTPRKYPNLTAKNFISSFTLK